MAATPTMKYVHAIVVAHPDDESMFFIPTIQALSTGVSPPPVSQSQPQELPQRSTSSHEVWLLCLTTGDYDGLGKIRTQELIDVCQLIGISKLVILDDDGDDGHSGDIDTQTQISATKKIIDHPKKRWDPQQVSKVIRQMLLGEIGVCHDYQNKVTQKKEKQQHQEGEHCSSSDDNLLVDLITFDEVGVSGHINHIDTYLGVCQLLKEEEQGQEKDNHDDRKIVVQSASKLHTETNIFVKYIPIWSWFLLFIHVMLSMFATKETSVRRRRSVAIRRSSTNGNSVAAQREKQILYRLNDPLLNWKAMKTHQSQFVWYRRLFVVFSCYTYYNILTPIVIETTASSTETNTTATAADRRKNKKML